MNCHHDITCGRECETCEHHAVHVTEWTDENGVRRRGEMSYCRREIDDSGKAVW